MTASKKWNSGPQPCWSKLSLPRSASRVANAAVPLLAGCTFENGIVGYAVGDDNGKPAFRAMCDGAFLGHILNRLSGIFLPQQKFLEPMSTYLELVGAGWWLVAHR